MPLPEYIATCQQRLNQTLQGCLPAPDAEPSRLHQAMHYATHSGGKRIRPLLVYATGEAFGTSLSCLDIPAVAIELIHTYSLIHDDLPAMDDDDYRRNMPTCHRAFDEATAILAGDALQSLAFDVLSTAPELTAEQRIAMIHLLANASGSLGMAGGQAQDLQATPNINQATLEAIHQRKTGALLQASVGLGMLASENVSPTRYQQLQTYARALGLAFQLQDDLFDHKETTVDGTTNYVQLLGVSGTQRKIQQLFHTALQQLGSYDAQHHALHQLTHYLLDRTH